MKYILLVITMAVCLSSTIIVKFCTNRFKNKDVMYHIYNLILSLVSCIGLFAVSGGVKLSPFTFGLGVVFGVVTAMQTVFSMKAISKGPLSYTTVLTSLSTIIPAMSGYVFWNEEISTVQIAGVFLMLVCFVLSVDYSASDKKASVSWLLYVLGAFILTGLIGVMQKWHQNTPYKIELDGFLITAFAISTVYSLVQLLIAKQKHSFGFSDFKSEVSLCIIILIVIAGACVAANNKINLYLSGVLDSAVFFPVVNGGQLILAALASYIIFKERLSLQKLIGFGIGIIAVILLCNPF